MKRSPLLCLVPLLASCWSARDWTNPAQSVVTELEEQAHAGNYIYFLNFNHDGLLASPGELLRLTRDLKGQSSGTRTGRCRRVIVTSLGWGHNPHHVYKDYLELIEQFAPTHAKPNTGEPGQDDSFTAIVCVSWSASQQGVTRILDAIIPVPFVGEILGYVPDSILFPLTFWSKSGLAHRIGTRGLRNSLETALHDAPSDLPLHFLGHSFGCAAIVALLAKHNYLEPVDDDDATKLAFKHHDRVSSATLIQPAVEQWALGQITRQGCDHPVVTTWSRHDRANRVLFPIANAIVPSLGVKWFRNWRAPALVDATLTPLGLLAGYAGGTWTFLADHAYGLINRPGSQVADTLATMPGTSAVVRLFDDEDTWASRGKGLLDLGYAHESAGGSDMAKAELLGVGWPKQAYDSIRSTSLSKVLDASSLPIDAGLVLVDCSHEMRTGTFSWLLGDMDRPWNDHFFNYFDPQGSHSDYKQESIGELIRLVIQHAERSSVQ